MKTPTYLTSILTATLLGACGGPQSSGSSGTGTCTPGSTASISITAMGVTPEAVCVLPNGTVTFTNTDTATHDIEESGTTCTQLNLGPIAAGTSKTTAAFPAVEVCQFHDQLNATNTAFQGTVAVTTAPQPGPGY